MSLRLIAATAPAMLSAALTIAGLLLFGLAPRERVPVGLRLEESYPFTSCTVARRGRSCRRLATTRNPIGWLLSAGGLAASLNTSRCY